MSPVNFPLTSYDWATSAKQGTTLKRISEGFSRYGSEANMPTWPRRIPLASLALMAFVTGKLAQYSPRSIRLCCTGCTPHPDTMMQDLSHSYTRAFDANCECGSKVMTVTPLFMQRHRLFVPMKGSSLWKKRAEKKYEADRHGGVVLYSSPVPPLSRSGRSERLNTE